MDDPLPVHGLMSYCVDLALKSVSLFYEPRSFKDAMDGPCFNSLEEGCR